MKSLVLLAVISAVCAFYRVPTRVNYYRYSRTLTNGTKVHQYAAAIASGPRVFVSTRVYRQYGAHLQSSQFLIDFSTDPIWAVLKIHGICLLVPVDCNMTFDDVVDKLENRTGQVVTDVLTEEYLDATEDGARLNSTERYQLFASNPSVKKLCNPYHTPIYKAFISTEALSEPGDCEKRVSTVTLDELERITIPVKYGYRCGFHHYG